ncbi:hypothetical protein TWF694_011400 [Orbilia ellipsospora]|uniref:Uncharacterized protein n=1 Tax=Orbilia ellipsospora TaxID=2528407 RepID=A0AAV9X548_9PEZI
MILNIGQPDQVVIQNHPESHTPITSCGAGPTIDVPTGSAGSLSCPTAVPCAFNCTVDMVIDPIYITKTITTIETVIKPVIITTTLTKTEWATVYAGNCTSYSTSWHSTKTIETTVTVSITQEISSTTYVTAYETVKATKTMLCQASGSANPLDPSDPSTPNPVPNPVPNPIPDPVPNPILDPIPNPVPVPVPDQLGPAPKPVAVKPANLDRSGLGWLWRRISWNGSDKMPTVTDTWREMNSQILIPYQGRPTNAQCAARKRKPWHALTAYDTHLVNNPPKLPNTASFYSSGKESFFQGAFTLKNEDWVSWPLPHPIYRANQASFGLQHATYNNLNGEMMTPSRVHGYIYNSHPSEQVDFVAVTLFLDGHVSSGDTLEVAISPVNSTTTQKPVLFRTENPDYPLGVKEVWMTLDLKMDFAAGTGVVITKEVPIDMTVKRTKPTGQEILLRYNIMDIEFCYLDGF